MTGGHRPVPEGPVFMEYEHPSWVDEYTADIETTTLPQFIEAMTALYEDWYEFVEWMERRQER